MDLYITIGLVVFGLFFLSSAFLNIRVLNAYNKATEAWILRDTTSGEKWQKEGRRREEIALRHPFNRWMGKRTWFSK